MSHRGWGPAQTGDGCKGCLGSRRPDPMESQLKNSSPALSGAAHRAADAGGAMGAKDESLSGPEEGVVIEPSEECARFGRGESPKDSSRSGKGL